MVRLRLGRPAAVIGLMVPSDVGRSLLSLVAELPDDVNPIAAVAASVGFDRADV